MTCWPARCDTTRAGSIWLHHGLMARGSLAAGGEVGARVDYAIGEIQFTKALAREARDNAKKALADMISGQVVGFGVGGVPQVVNGATGVNNIFYARSGGTNDNWTFGAASGTVCAAAVPGFIAFTGI